MNSGSAVVFSVVYVGASGRQVRAVIASVRISTEINSSLIATSSGPPESYRINSKKEQLLLSYADNFTRQFKKLYGDRKPQFLRPLNECGVEVETLSPYIKWTSSTILLVILRNLCVPRYGLLACPTKSCMSGTALLPL